MADVLDQIRSAFDSEDTPKKNLALRKAHDEIELLRVALVRYGDRLRMSTVEPMALQQVIDAAFERTPPPATNVAAYRLLSEGEIVQKGDQPLNDDCNSWGELVGWEIGIAYYPSVFVPIRRAIATTEGSTDA